MEIKLLQDFGVKVKGQVFNASTSLGASLIKKGIATTNIKEEAKAEKVKKEKSTKKEE